VFGKFTRRDKLGIVGMEILLNHPPDHPSDHSPNQAHPTTPRLRHFRRNFILFLIDSILFGTAFGIVSPGGLVPDFASKLTSSEALIGATASLYSVAWFLPQLILAQIVNRSERKKPFFNRFVLPFRTFLLIAGGLISLYSPDANTAILLTFVIGYGLFAATDGVISLAWADLLGTSLPGHWRGTLFGLAAFITAIAAIGAREVVRHILGTVPFPDNYALVFIVASVLWLAGGVCLLFTVEEERDEPYTPGPPMHEYFPYVGNVVRSDAQFRTFMFMRLMLDLTLIAPPFYVIVGRQQLGIPSEIVVSDALLFGTFGGALASLLMSILSRRSGSRAVLRVACVAAMIHPMLALLALDAGANMLRAAFFAVGFRNAIAVPALFDWVITYAPPNRRPIYVGITNTVSAVSNFAPLFGGVILGMSSFPVLFVACSVIAVLALVISTRLIEPRSLKRTLSPSGSRSDPVSA
jgi:MFS family permease